MQIVYKEGVQEAFRKRDFIKVEDFLATGEYDQNDWAKISYDDLYEYIQNLKNELKSKRFVR